MNRKKIAILLTGLLLTSSIFTSCGSSTSNDKNTKDNQKASRSQDLSRSRMFEEYDTDLSQIPDNFMGDSMLEVEAEVKNGENYKGSKIGETSPNNQIQNRSIEPNENNMSRSMTEENLEAPGIQGGIIDENFYSNVIQGTDMDENFYEAGMNSRTIDFNPYGITDESHIEGNQTINEVAPFSETNSANETNPLNETKNDEAFNFDNTSDNSISGLPSASNDEFNFQNENLNSSVDGEKENVSPSQENASNSPNGSGDIKRGNKNAQKIREENEKYAEEYDKQVKDGAMDYKVIKDESKIAGQISVVNVKGGVELTGTPKVAQGTAEISFKLSGDILSATPDGVNLGNIMEAAYQETIKDANTGFTSSAATTEREKLQTALATLFKPASACKLMFRSLNDNSVKAISFIGTNFFPVKSSDPDYVKHIIDLDLSSQSLNMKNARNISPSDIVLKMKVRVSKPTATNGLDTNTEYEYIGIRDNLGIKIDGSTLSSKDELTGFALSKFTTSKRPSVLEAKDASVSVIYKGTGASASTQETNTFYLSDITSNHFIDMKKMIDASKVIADGTSIKFSTVKFMDPDSTITRIEIEDDRGTKYPVSLVPENVYKPELGSYMQVTGLKRDTPYVFTKLNIYSNLNNKSEVQTIHFANIMTSLSSKIVLNDIAIRTKAFAAPALTLGASHSSTVTLPNKLAVNAVKNGMTSLRYVLKVGDPEGTVGDVSVNGLKSGEESKVEKFVDTNTKENYYVVTLSKLTKGTDYGFLILETSYKDADGKLNYNRQTLKDINSGGSGVTDNTTELTELTGSQAFNVILNESNKSDEPRSIKVPIFIDDINNKFVKIEFTPPKDNPEAKVTLLDNELEFTNLKPESNSLCKVDFIYLNNDNKEEKSSKYIRVITSKVNDLDIKDATVTTTDVDALVKFEFYSEPKSTIKTVAVKDGTGKEVTSTWEDTTKTIKITGLKGSTEYKDLTATFTLDNGKTITYPITVFKTDVTVIKPTGKVADFVARVYKTALGREPEVQGWEYWVKKLESKEISASNFIAENLMTQNEFVERELSKKSFINVMYSLIVNRESDEQGQAYWERKYEEYRPTAKSIEELRIKIAREMMEQSEFKDLVGSMNIKY